MDWGFGMSRSRLLLALIGLVLVTAISDVTPDQAEAKRHGTPEYIALGDEIAFGRGLADPGEGYVSLFGTFLQGPHGVSGKLSVTNLAMDDGTIWEVTGEQLPVALEAIEARNSDGDKKNDVEVVTIDAGLPELFCCIFICIEGSLAECIGSFGETLFWHSLFMDWVLNALRNAGGPGLQIIVMTNYNPFLNPGCYFNYLVPAWDAALEGNPEYGLEQGMNDITRNVAEAYGAQVADVYELVGPGELTADCGNLVGLSPNAAGHALIAEEFARVFEAKKPR